MYMEAESLGGSVCGSVEDNNHYNSLESSKNKEMYKGMISESSCDWFVSDCDCDHHHFDLRSESEAKVWTYICKINIRADQL